MEVLRLTMLVFLLWGAYSGKYEGGLVGLSDRFYIGNRLDSIPNYPLLIPKYLYEYVCCSIGSVYRIKSFNFFLLTSSCSAFSNSGLSCETHSVLDSAFE